MTSFMLVIALVAFLAGATAAVFLMLVIGIRKDDRPERILRARIPRPGACARSVLNSGTWPNVPVYRNDHEDDWPENSGTA